MKQNSSETQHIIQNSIEDTLPIMESFYTIQGEGFHSGKAAYFIRLGGCDVGCHWCDVKESWPAEGHQMKSYDELISEIKLHPCNTIVITGGEPLMYDMTSLTLRLKERGYKTCLETSGAYALSGDWHWICLSPKKFKAPVDGIHIKADELKVIIFNKSDFAWAEKHAEKVSPDCMLYLQPEWDQRAKMMPEIVNYVKDHPKWNISLQTHKYLGIP